MQSQAKVNVKAAFFQLDETVRNVWRSGAAEVHIHLHFQNLENKGYFKQPLEHQWRYKGGQTISHQVELPPKEFDDDSAVDFLYRSVANALAQAMNKSTNCEGFVMIPYGFSVADEPFVEPEYTEE